MKGILPSLTGVMLCATTLHSATADSTVPLEWEGGDSEQQPPGRKSSKARPLTTG